MNNLSIFFVLTQYEFITIEAYLYIRRIIQNQSKINMKSITVKELKEMIDKGEDFQLIDVREQSEYDAANLKGVFIPLATVPQNVEKISKDKKVVVHCRSGKRSANAISFLENNYGYTNLYNLEGGIIAYKNEIDDSLDVV